MTAMPETDQQHESPEQRKAERRQAKLTFLFVGWSFVISNMFVVFSSGYGWQQHLGPFAHLYTYGYILTPEWAIIGVSIIALFLLIVRPHKIFTAIFASFAVLIWYGWIWLYVAMSV